MWVWIWSAVPAPATLPMFMPILKTGGLKGILQDFDRFDDDVIMLIKFAFGNFSRSAIWR